MDEKHRLLKKYWGYDRFRPLQEEIIESVLQGHDTLALLPTGGGKSLCYQLPALAREGLCLVVSPLIALMKDQVQQLNDRHLKAACIVSGLSSTEIRGVLNNAVSGTLKFLYVSPERLQQRLFIEHLRRMQVNLIAVDEAHCVSQWGYDFRPPYLQIARIREYHPATPVLALTATATPLVANDICRLLQLRDCRRYQSSFVRPNLTYMVLHDNDKHSRLLRMVKHLGGSGIVYTRNRRSTQTIAQTLVGNGISATNYHAGLDAAERDRRQALWMSDKCQVMVATNAFGMGIDKPNVRFVVHMDVPESLEAYFQEAGRAGRDGLPSYAVIICDPSDKERMRRDFEADYPTVKQVRNVYRALGNYYRIPLGSGADTQYNFDIEDLCTTYSFRPRELFGACRILEREGLIAIPGGDDPNSTLFVPMGRNDLYRFQVDHQRLGDLLQATLRLYPGLLSGVVPIDERRIARRCNIEPTEVVEMLVQLRDMHVVEYRPKAKGPQLFFLSERIDERQIYPSEEHYGQLKDAAHERLKAVVAYLDNGSLCRSRQLVGYFGEQSTCNCGHCDVCLRSQPKTDTDQAILRQLRLSPMKVQGLCALLDEEGYPDASDTLREMMDRGEVVVDSATTLVRLP